MDVAKPTAKRAATKTVVLCKRQTRNEPFTVIGVVNVATETADTICVRYRGDYREFNKTTRREVFPRPSSFLTYITHTERAQDRHLPWGKHLVNLSQRKKNST